jgi:tRNA-dihydrouridine synthase B
MFSQPLQIGSLSIANRAVLAPLAGVSDVPFRRICQELGAGLTFVEMLSAVALQYNSRRTMEMLARHPSEKILGVQVTGPKPEGVASCVRMLDDLGFDVIDINMGCPVRKVVGSGSGSAFLKDLGRIEQTVLAARAMTAKALTVKIRLGFTPETINVEETAAIIARCGADMITIHGRTREDSYAVRVSYPGIAAGLRVAKAIRPSIATLGNGDVMDVVSGETMLRETGCDGVMVSRGALGNPWIFRDLTSGANRQPTVAEWEEVVLRHLDYHAAHYGDSLQAAKLTRKHLIWYSSGLPHANRFREICNQVSSMQEARDIVRRFASQLPRDARRYEDSRAAAGHDPKFDMDRQLDRGVGDDGLPSAGPGPAAG